MAAPIGSERRRQPSRGWGSQGRCCCLLGARGIELLSVSRGARRSDYAEGGDGMIGAIVTIGPGENLDRQRASAVAEQEAPMFEGMDGLRSKVFMWDEETGIVTNTYVWDSEPAARAFFSSPEVKAKIV